MSYTESHQRKNSADISSRALEIKLPQSTKGDKKNRARDEPSQKQQGGWRALKIQNQHSRWMLTLVDIFRPVVLEAVGGEWSGGFGFLCAWLSHECRRSVPLPSTGLSLSLSPSASQQPSTGKRRGRSSNPTVPVSDSPSSFFHLPTVASLGLAKQFFPHLSSPLASSFVSSFPLSLSPLFSPLCPRLPFSPSLPSSPLLFLLSVRVFLLRVGCPLFGETFWEEGRVYASTPSWLWLFHGFFFKDPGSPLRSRVAPACYADGSFSRLSRPVRHRGFIFGTLMSSCFQVPMASLSV